MSVPFITRAPKSDEIERLRLAMSTFRNGSGQEKGKDQSTRPGWRDFERIIAEIFNGKGTENKEVFDVIVSSTTVENVDYGISAKSKELGRSTAIEDLNDSGRVYMELTNSPAKLWKPLKAEGIAESDFENKREAEKIGETITNVIENWHIEAKEKHPTIYNNRSLDLDNSIYLVISYSKSRNNKPRHYQIHSFDLNFPQGIIWDYKSGKCLTGYDPEYPDEPLVDWYALSGGQFKYYPRASSCRFSCEQFTLALPKRESISDKVRRYWPNAWAGAKGESCKQ